MTATPPEDPRPAGDRLLPWGKVKDLAGISRTTAWRLQNSGAFPRPVVISRGRVGWRESEVAAWKAALAPRGSDRRDAPLFDPGPPRAPPPPAAPAPDRPPPVHVEKPRRSNARRRRTHIDQMSFDF